MFGYSSSIWHFSWIVSKIWPLSSLFVESTSSLTPLYLSAFYTSQETPLPRTPRASPGRPARVYCTHVTQTFKCFISSRLVVIAAVCFLHGSLIIHIYQHNHDSLYCFYVAMIICTRNSILCTHESYSAEWKEHLRGCTALYWLKHAIIYNELCHWLYNSWSETKIPFC